MKLSLTHSPEVKLSGSVDKALHFYLGDLGSNPTLTSIQLHPTRCFKLQRKVKTTMVQWLTLVGCWQDCNEELWSNLSTACFSLNNPKVSIKPVENAQRLSGSIDKAWCFHLGDLGSNPTVANVKLLSLNPTKCPRRQLSAWKPWWC